MIRSKKVTAAPNAPTPYSTLRAGGAPPRADSAPAPTATSTARVNTSAVLIDNNGLRTIVPFTGGARRRRVTAVTAPDPAARRAPPWHTAAPLHCCLSR